MEKEKKIEIIQHAIAHLNGYALIVQARVGYTPVAVYDTIKGLKKLTKEVV